MHYAGMDGDENDSITIYGRITLDSTPPGMDGDENEDISWQEFETAVRVQTPPEVTLQERHEERQIRRQDRLLHIEAGVFLRGGEEDPGSVSDTTEGSAEGEEGSPTEGGHAVYTVDRRYELEKVGHRSCWTRCRHMLYVMSECVCDFAMTFASVIVVLVLNHHACFPGF